MTPKDRRRIAEHLYGKREWTMRRIADALGVTHKTVSKDLSEFVPEVQNTKKSRGRPKGSRPKPLSHEKVAGSATIVTMSNAPKTTSEVIAEGTAELIALCEHLPDRRFARAAQAAFRKASVMALKAAAPRKRKLVT